MVKKHKSRRQSKKAPYISPHTVRVGEIYKGSIHFSCYNRYWKISSLPNGDMVNIRCTNCNKERTVFLSAISNDFELYSTPDVKSNGSVATHTLNSHCLIGLYSTRSCSNNSHKIKDVIAKIPIKINGRPQIANVDAWYCETCNVYYILHSTYDSISGIPICDVKDFRTGKIISCARDYENVIASDYETMLHKLGYNVSQKEGLSSQERHDILAQIVRKRQISKNEIISLLQYYIRRNENNDNMVLAVEKWSEDLVFIKQFKVQSGESIDVERIRIR